METWKPSYENSTEFSNRTKTRNMKYVRTLKIPKSENGSCGFNLTRSKWDPYPWVNAVFVGTPAYVCGLKAGDCVLEVNGGDVLGLCLTDIAKLVHAKSKSVTLLLWNAGCQAECNDESIFCGPLPRNLTRLTAVLQTILQLIECPICLETIKPPALQCQNGHLVCVNCRIRSINCSICRDRFTPRRAHVAEQLHAAITSAFDLCRNEDKLRQKLFGCKAHKTQEQQNKSYITAQDTAHLSTHKISIKTNSMESLLMGKFEHLTQIKDNKSHLTKSQCVLKAQQTSVKSLCKLKLAKETASKKYSVSTNDLSQPLGTLTLNSYSSNAAGQYVLITPDAPLITSHSVKCAEQHMEMALEVKSASSSTLSLPTNTSQCGCYSKSASTTESFAKTTCSCSSQPTASPTSSLSSGIFTSTDDNQSSTANIDEEFSIVTSLHPQHLLKQRQCNL